MAFYTSLSMWIKAIAGLISIIYHLWKLSNRNKLQTIFLPYNHILKELLEKRFSPLLSYHCFSLEYITSKQQATIKSSIVNANSCLNRIFPSFDFFNKEFYLGNRLVDSFSNHFSFHKTDYSLEESKFHHYSCLNNIVLNVLSNLSTVIVVFDISIKNSITISIAHVHSSNNPLKKILYYAINIISTEVELFAIRYRISQAIQIPGTSCIIIITDILHVAQRIFDSTIYLYQIQAITIFKDFQRFFKEHSNNSVMSI